MKDPRVDAYIIEAPEYARPILIHLRNLVHSAFPEISENIKWGMPSFEYKGLVCGMAAHKKHTSFMIHKAELIKDPNSMLEVVGKSNMGAFGKLTSIDQLPDNEVVINYIQQVIELNRKGIKGKIKSPEKNLIPDSDPDFMKALNENVEAKNAFADFSPSSKKEYIEWITEAKTEATKFKRIIQAVEWIAEGKPRNWKYMKKYKV